VLMIMSASGDAAAIEMLIREQKLQVNDTDKVLFQLVINFHVVPKHVTNPRVIRAAIQAYIAPRRPKM
jgi:hypothetical protein